MAWRELITRNFGWKIASVVLATLLWFMLRSSEDTRAGWGTERAFPNCEITVMTAASDDHAYRVEPAHVAVVVAGSAQRLQRLKATDIEVYVNLTTITEASGLRKRVQVFAPSGVQLVRMTPPEVTITSLPVPQRELEPAPAPAGSKP